MPAGDEAPGPKVKGRWDLAWGGIASLGWRCRCCGRHGQRGIAIERIGRVDGRCACPAGRAERAKGVLAVGADADFVVFDPDAEWTVAPADLHFRHKLSPYLGAKLRGRCSRPGCAASVIFRAGATSVGEARGTRAGATMKERAQRAIASADRIADHERGAGPHHAPLPHAARARRSCTSARAHGSSGHDRPRRCGRQSARPLAAGWNSRSKRLVLGSHIDTVPDAGAFDGVLGVTLALEWVELAQELKIRRWPSRSSPSLRKKACALACRFLAAARSQGASIRLLALKDAEGITMEAAIRAFGLDPAEIDEAASDADAIGLLSRFISSRARCLKRKD